MYTFLVVIALLFFGVFVPGGAASAHAGEPLSPHDVWSAWNFDPIIWFGIFLTGFLYARGVRSLWRNAGSGRGVTRGQTAAFAGGLFFLSAALISPIDAMAEVLFSAHMVQHMLLIMGAAPLLVLGIPPAAAAWSIPSVWRVSLGRWWLRQNGLRAIWNFLINPWVVWILHGIALVAWHIPRLYEAALLNEFYHALEHFSFLITAFLFWWVVVRCGKQGGMNHGFGMLYVFSMAMFSGVLGALITFSRQAWYPFYALTTQEWGLTLIEDQQLAGVIMWIPGNFVYLVAFLTLLAQWFKSMEQNETRSKAGSP